MRTSATIGTTSLSPANAIAILIWRATQCREQRLWSEALTYYKAVLAFQPEHADVTCDIGTALQMLGLLQPAATSLIHALALQPQFARAAYNLGVLFQSAGHLDYAVAAYRGVIAAAPGDASAWGNLGCCREECSGLDDARDAHRRSLQLDPANPTTAMNLVMAKLYRPGVSLAEIHAGARRFAALHGDPLTAAAPGHRRLSTAETRRPRIGIISGDFRRHAVGHLTVPAVERLSGLGYDLTCYMTSVKSDDVTGRFQRSARCFSSVVSLTDEVLAAQIRADAIDILIDLSGFTAGNRLLVFARKPAPIQLSWVGYPATTGLAAIDYLLADHWQIPAGAEAFYSEKLIRLPDSSIAFEPPATAAEIPALPALTNGYVTFGSFNGVKKLNGEVIALWSRLLRDLPMARLVIKAEAFSLPGTERRYRDAFAGCGIDDARVTFFGSSSQSAHQAAMAATDIALDPFPYNGGQTSLETLWAGVPLITLPGETMASRHSMGYLGTAGLSELVARDPDHYVALARSLALDLPRLMNMRTSLRDRLTASKLCDLTLFSRHVDTALLAIWARYCQGQPPANLSIGADSVACFDA